MRPKTTIFRQLVFSIILPVVIGFILTSVVNYYNARNHLVEANDTQNRLIIDEIFNVLQFQDVTLNLVESSEEYKLKAISDNIVNVIFNSTEGIERRNLNEVRALLNMNPELEDIYIINKRGLIVNTTYEKDLGLNLFGFGDEYKHFLQNIMKERLLVVDDFAPERTTRRLKKFSYQSTNDGRYIVEIGMYSPKADAIMAAIQKRLNEMAKANPSMVSVDLFVGGDDPFSLNQMGEINDKHRPIIQKMFKTKGDTVIVQKEDGKRLEYKFSYKKRTSNDGEIGKDAVVRIVSDRSNEINALRVELFKAIAMFVFISIVLSILLFRSALNITRPINNLLSKTRRIARGNLDERVDIVGRNEITALSENFNIMVEKMEAAYYEIIEQKTSLEDSIHYAKRIQDALIPTQDKMKESLPNSFTFFLSKDIVSGDFYWIKEVENRVLYAAVDCTGHGVPGAFMSLVGFNGLNSAVREYNLHQPNTILERLNEIVINTLKRGDKEINDGMDMALCSLDIKNRILEYAGANNPIYIVRPKNRPAIENASTCEIENSDFILYEVKADKQPIGGHSNEKVFTNHRYNLLEGDTVYVFSDGYADQFGGPNQEVRDDGGKKFKYKQFKNVLLANQNETMAKQKEILYNAFLEWKGNLEQLDDIVVIGVKL